MGSAFAICHCLTECSESRTPNSTVTCRCSAAAFGSVLADTSEFDVLVFTSHTNDIPTIYYSNGDINQWIRTKSRLCYRL